MIINQLGQFIQKPTNTARPSVSRRPVMPALNQDLFQISRAQSGQSRQVRFSGDDDGMTDPDTKRFWDIVKGVETPEHLLDQITRGGLKIGQDGGVTLPMPTINRPTFSYKPNSDSNDDGDGDGDGDGQGGPGQGPGKGGGVGSNPGAGPGDVIGQDGDGEGDGQGGKGAGQGGGGGGREKWERRLTGTEVAKLLEQLELPYLQDKGRGQFQHAGIRWNNKRQPPPGIPLRESYDPAIARETFHVSQEQKKFIGELYQVAFGREPQDDELDYWKDVLKELEADNQMDLENVEPLLIGEFLTSEQYQQQFGGKTDKMISDAYKLAIGKAPSRHGIELWSSKLETGLTVKDMPLALYQMFGDKMDSRRRNIVFNPDNLIIAPKEVRRIDWKEHKKPFSQAVIFYVMDVSGSISDQDKEMARMNNYLLSTWVKYQYGLKVAKMQGKKYNDKEFFGKSVAERHIIFTETAKEVDADEFYTTSQSGGTSISSGLKMVEEIIDKDYPPKDWNVYVFVYSDGDSWSDNDKSVKIIQDLEKKGINLMAYGHLGQRSSISGSNFANVLNEKFKESKTVRLAVLDRPEMKTYKEAIKAMLAKEKEAV